MASTQTTAKANIAKLPLLKDHVYTMVAAFAGVVFGVLGSLGFIGGYMHSQFAQQTAALSHVAMANASDTMCVGSSSASGAASSANKPATAVTTSSSKPSTGGGMGGGMGGGGSQPGGSGHNFWVSQVGGGSISYTGQGSKNIIATQNTATYTEDNHNNVGVTNLNFQGASSGNATSKDNTTSGNTASGKASNNNSTSTDVNISN